MCIQTSLTFFHLFTFQQDGALDENGFPVQLTAKTVEKTKRPAEGSPENVPSRKRAAFGDITNVRKISRVFKCIQKEKLPV